MFSETGMFQEIAALVIAAIALIYVISKLTGWPRRPRRSGNGTVVTGGRLSRGLKAAEQAQKTAGDPRPPQ